MTAPHTVAGHTAGIELPEGMVPWHGGDGAPADWDGGPVKLRCGDMEPANLIEDADWQVGYPENGFKPCRIDVVAYTPVRATAARQSGEDV